MLVGCVVGVGVVVLWCWCLKSCLMNKVDWLVGGVIGGGW